MFFGIDLTKQSIIFAILTALSQGAQLHLSPAMREDRKDKKEAKEKGEKPSTPEELAKNMQSSMKYMMPVMIGVFAYFVPAAVAVYWVVSNLFTIVQELVIKKRIENKKIHA